MRAKNDSRRFLSAAPSAFLTGNNLTSDRIAECQRPPGELKVLTSRVVHTEASYPEGVRNHQTQAVSRLKFLGPLQSHSSEHGFRDSCKDIVRRGSGDMSSICVCTESSFPLNERVDVFAVRRAESVGPRILGSWEQLILLVITCEYEEQSTALSLTLMS